VAGPPEDPPGARRRRPLLIGLIAVLTAIAFWRLAPPTLPGSGGDEPTATDATGPEPSPEPTSTEGGGYQNPDEQVETAPPARAPQVPVAAAADGVLSLLILGDRQVLTWAEPARAILEDRLAAATGPWRGAKVELTVRSGDAWTAADALHHLQSTGWQTDRPELVLVAVGWEDGGPGRALPAARTAIDGSTTWLTDLAAVPARRATGDPRFYLRPNEGLPALEPLRHLEFLDTIGLEAAEHGAAAAYLEQPVRHELGDRRLFPSTGMRPQPWISTVYGLESQPDPLSLYSGDDPLGLNEAGGALVGRFVGLGLVQIVLGG
jgi:hypothetical protein